MSNISEHKIKNITLLNTVLSSNMFAFAAKIDQADVSEDIDENLFLDNIVFFKRLSGSDVRLLVKSELWEPKEYHINDFVITEKNRIYICTRTGTGQEPTHISGAQSYGNVEWQFCETVSSEDLIAFDLEGHSPLSLKNEKMIYSGHIRKLAIAFDIMGEESGYLPLTTEFNVTGLYANPFDRSMRTTVVNKEKVKEYGYPLAWTGITDTSRTLEQIDSYTFFVTL